jgi:hypothetical protein
MVHIMAGSGYLILALENLRNRYCHHSEMMTADAQCLYCVWLFSDDHEDHNWIRPSAGSGHTTDCVHPKTDHFVCHVSDNKQARFEVLIAVLRP